MKNIQVIDEAINADYAVWAATDEEFELIFPDEGQDIEFIEDFCARVSEDVGKSVLNAIWERKLNKKEINGIHGTLFYGLPEKKKFYENKREPVLGYSTGMQ